MLEWLEKWYKNQCNESWENVFGINIQTAGNPGWRIEIDLKDTGLEGKPFEYCKKYISRDDFYICQIKDNQFQAACDIFKLEKMIGIFKEWVESGDNS